LIPVLVASGMPTHEFVFEGFLPHKKGRRTKLERLKNEQRTIVLYESPHRILKTLTELLEYCGDRKVVVGREITKIYEEIIRGNLSEVVKDFSTRIIKGEFVIVLQGIEI
jgi:16S rRNA (cytidine1402-2'-O)-methyltransferase